MHDPTTRDPAGNQVESETVAVHGAILHGRLLFYLRALRIVRHEQESSVVFQHDGHV